MKPTWQTDDGRIQLYRGDARQVLPELAGVDAIICDPPYGIGYRHGGTGGGLHTRRLTKPIAGDDRPFDPREFLTGRIQFALLFGADHFRDRLPPGGTFIAWDKSVGKGPADSFADAEFAWCSAKIKRNVARFLWKGICQCEKKGRRFHPAEKPEALMRWCLGLCSKALTICDPFADSGTTIVAAVELGRRAVGIELDRGHFRTMVRRVKAALSVSPCPHVSVSRRPRKDVVA